MSKFTYKVINARMGKKVGSVVEYDHEPCAEFLACLEKVETVTEKRLEVATPAKGKTKKSDSVSTQSTQQSPKSKRG